MAIDVEERAMASGDRKRMLANVLPNLIVGTAIALLALFGLNAWLWWN